MGVKFPKIAFTALCLAASTALGGLFGLGGGLSPVGASKEEWAASTNLAEARNIISTNADARLGKTTNTLNDHCISFFAKDLKLVAFTNDVVAGSYGGGITDDPGYIEGLSIDWTNSTSVFLTP